MGDTSPGTLTLVHGGDVYAPAHRGVQSVLVGGGSILKVGEVGREALSRAGLQVEEIDASGCLVVPGFVDPHEHIVGAGGEHGFESRMPEMTVEEIARAGITTVVGCLGTDVATRTLSSLVAKAQQLRTGGISAYIFTGGFSVPPQTMSGSVRDDLVFIDLAIGLGEVAIADFRSSEPSLHELARLVSEAIIGGLLSGKAGVTHFHTGDGDGRLAVVMRLIDELGIPPRFLYPAHANRSQVVLSQAVELAERGSYVDMDTVDGEFEKWLRAYIDLDGPLGQLTVSSDAHTPGGEPAKVYDAFVAAVHSGLLELEQALPLFTLNPATVLSLHGKGCLEEGRDGDLLVIRRDSLELMHVIAGGRPIVKDGTLMEPTE
jgi:beta-aspartyl-dipeptidase (metallo-type)